MKKKQNRWIKQTILYSIIPFLLLLFWVSASSIVFSKPYFVLTSNHTSPNMNSWVGKELLQGESMQNTITATDDNMGTIDVRFFNFNRISDDAVVFRIKEIHAKNWYYQNTYTVNQFLPNEFFTFGFPVIKNSKGKTYLFTIQSKAGKHKNAITISNISPQIMSIYSVEKSKLKNPAYLGYFLIRKASQIFSNDKIFQSSLLFLVPFIIYILFILVFLRQNLLKALWNKMMHSSLYKRLIVIRHRNKILRQYSFFQIFFTLFLVFLLLDVFSLQLNHLLFILFFYLVWFVIIRCGQLDSSVSFSFAFACLLLHIIFLVGKNEQIANNFSLWFDVFFITGISQVIFQRKKVLKHH